MLRSASSERDLRFSKRFESSFRYSEENRSWVNQVVPQQMLSTIRSKTDQQMLSTIRCKTDQHAEILTNLVIEVQEEFHRVFEHVFKKNVVSSGFNTTAFLQTPIAKI